MFTILQPEHHYSQLLQRMIPVFTRPHVAGASDRTREWLLSVRHALFDSQHAASQDTTCSYIFGRCVWDAGLG